MVLLLNHGVFTVGPSVAMAFDHMHGMEMACKVQVSVGIDIVFQNRLTTDQLNHL